jgi:organic hydroperoxide reductase OsmC/OhrA
MLFFLDFARRGGFLIDSYEDNAEGVLAKDADGRMAMTVVTLRPKVAFSGGKRPTKEELDDLHHRSHEACFIANSVKTEVRVEA